MAPSHERDTDDPGVERVIVNIDGQEELSAIREALDGIREDIDWWIKNHRREQWTPMQPIPDMPANPLAQDWVERVKNFTAADAPDKAANNSPKPAPSSRQAGTADGLDDETHFCCEAPDLQWTGDPQFPGVACQNCGYIVADCGSVVMQPSPQADPEPEPKEAQRALFLEE